VTRPAELKVRIEGSSLVTALAYPPAEPRTGARLVLAHGAGADQRSAFMSSFASAISKLGVETVTFNFPYTERRRRLPDRRPVLEACYRAVIASVGRRVGSSVPLFIGGKSMGGRIATHVAATGRDLPISGLVLLGYPLHPPGRPGERRDAHLSAIAQPMLFVQGTRDSFGTPIELDAVLSRLESQATLYRVAGGDHSFKLPGAGQTVQAAIFDDIQRTIVEWMRDVLNKGIA
jgi:predicted alpha/beta-hydrolase family hydrolase